METHAVTIKYRSRKDVFNLYPLGDIHCGSIFCVEDKIREQVKVIASDPHALWVGMGDYAECIVPSDPRWDTEGVAPWVERSNVAESQRKWIVKLFKPIAGQCIGLLTGNHEESIRLRNYQDIHLDICRDLGVKNLGYSAFVRLSFHRGAPANRDIAKFDCHFTHGAGAAQSEGGKLNRLLQAMMGFDADIFAMGHLHDIAIRNVPRIYLRDNLTIGHRVRAGAITGSWLKAYGNSPYASYAEKKGYRPTVLGCPVFRIEPDKRQAVAQSSTIVSD